MSLETKKIKTELCVIGGGIAGINVAITAARLGVRTVLIHERSVLGGNASGEVRMWVCGVQDYEYKETGIGEELNLENFYRNPTKNHYLWDTVLYGKVKEEKNISLFLNTTCFDASVRNGKIKSVTAYQMTTQTLYEVEADYFADCSGDSILAPLTGASFMYGRESQSEYNEPMKSHYAKDNCTMGNSVILQARQTNRKVPFIAPEWAEKVSVEKLKSKKLNLYSPFENFWYIELGGLLDTIKDAESINHRLIALCLGVWDTVKNSGEFDADNFELDFMGFLGAKRESRRMLGDYVLTANDIVEEKIFDDTVAYGGWPLDDHHAEGFDGEESNYTINLKRPYGIPYRCLYSKNVENLFFAGRNISATHMAMSSARVMGTCGIIGQAVGVASYIAKKYTITPRQVCEHIKEVQQILLYNDCFLPKIEREVSPVMKKVKVEGLVGGEKLFNGKDRNLQDEDNLTMLDNGKEIIYSLSEPTFVREAKIVFDSDLTRKSYGMHYVHTQYSTRCNTLLDSPDVGLPKTLVKRFCLRGFDENGREIILIDEKNNIRRNLLVPINEKISRIGLTVWENWGNTQKSGLFTLELV